MRGARRPARERAGRDERLGTALSRRAPTPTQLGRRCARRAQRERRAERAAPSAPRPWPRQARAHHAWPRAQYGAERRVLVGRARRRPRAAVSTAPRHALSARAASSSRRLVGACVFCVCVDAELDTARAKSTRLGAVLTASRGYSRPRPSRTRVSAQLSRRPARRARECHSARACHSSTSSRPRAPRLVAARRGARRCRRGAKNGARGGRRAFPAPNAQRRARACRGHRECAVPSALRRACRAKCAAPTETTQKPDRASRPALSAITTK